MTSTELHPGGQDSDSLGSPPWTLADPPFASDVTADHDVSDGRPNPPDRWSCDVNGNPEGETALSRSGNGNEALSLSPEPEVDDNRAGARLRRGDDRFVMTESESSCQNGSATDLPLPPRTLDTDVIVERMSGRPAPGFHMVVDPGFAVAGNAGNRAGGDSQSPRAPAGQISPPRIPASAPPTSACGAGGDSQSSRVSTGQISSPRTSVEAPPMTGCRVDSDCQSSRSPNSHISPPRTPSAAPPTTGSGPRRSRGLSDVFYPTPGYRLDVTSPKPEHNPAPVNEPIHMTLEEVRASLRRRLGDPAPEADGGESQKTGQLSHCRQRFSTPVATSDPVTSGASQDHHHRIRPHHHIRTELPEPPGSPTVRCLPRSLRHTLCHWLKIGRGDGGLVAGSGDDGVSLFAGEAVMAVDGRLLMEEDRRAGVPPPVPPRPEQLTPRTASEHQWESVGSPLLECSDENSVIDFAESLQRVKNYGWYWGPISGDEAEKALAAEPDGSFLVRDSTDQRYIFSLSFKWNGTMRHVRIEHDQGNFSFGTFTEFKSHTIVEFIENAVQHSLSGRFLFFLHQRPVLGPMRVQLLHPVSRFKVVQSLQHTCRFTILKIVRLDLVDRLPLPSRLKSYLRMPQYYTEETLEWPEAPGGRVADDSLQPGPLGDAT